ncbi:hypothetical protein BDY21DRAFT_203760 [Lineolata rhizophorae]|uniref:Uncharacterized protein n=1 Tax=Lineolata rhizophorae TaxID=578093 RepID=A0A6A6P5E7_9PEZI|nr:hypothetical protein BDY21DRAFT_203760 [Lineolata rhizophorae]
MCAMESERNTHGGRTYIRRDICACYDIRTLRLARGSPRGLGGDGSGQRVKCQTKPTRGLAETRKTGWCSSAAAKSLLGQFFRSTARARLIRCSFAREISVRRASLGKVVFGCLISLRMQVFRTQHSGPKMPASKSGVSAPRFVIGDFCCGIIMALYVTSI